jgi:hypothetical protein
MLRLLERQHQELYILVQKKYLMQQKGLLQMKKD